MLNINKIRFDRLETLRNAKKILILTHTDLDGAGAAVIAKSILADKNIDYISCTNNAMSDMIENNVVTYFDKNDYDFIIACDISCSETAAENINACPNNKRFLLLDHHKTAMHLNQYDWAIVEDMLPADATMRSDDNLERHISGTGILFYCLNFIRATNLVQKEFTSLVNDYDTWDWKNIQSRPECKELNDVMYIYGFDTFVNMMTERCNNPESIILGAFEKTLLEIEERRTKENVDRVIKTAKTGVIACTVNNNLTWYSYTLICTDVNLPAVFERMRETYPDKDMLMILTSNTISLRTDKPNIDVGAFAKIFGGGGHPAAAGIPVDFEFRFQLIKDVLEPECNILVDAK